MAILLKEEGLLSHSRLYATDLSLGALARAQAGVFPLMFMQDYTENYIKAGGHHDFSDYYVADSQGAAFDPSLKEHMIFSFHNLVTDRSFNEFQVILCRNVMIYFNQSLQNRVHKLLYESLSMFGVLGLGDKESLLFTPHEACYEVLDDKGRLFRRMA
jgi:chemotaxis protein methyltransferase CheR